jgi:peptide/nickel transport system substrate-binding protein
MARKASATPGSDQPNGRGIVINHTETTGPRRRAIALPTLVLSLAASSILILAGCGSSGATTGNAQAAAAPTNGGVLTIATDQDAEPSLFFSGSDPDDLVFSLVYNTLITYPHTSLTPQPSLATSWQLGNGGKSLTLQLRHGVKYSNGVPFTSADVEFSIKTIASPKWYAQFQRTAAAVTGFNTSKPYQVTLKFAHPLSNIFDLLSQVPMLEPGAMAGFASGKEYVGTGPFKFVSWTPGQKMVFTANDDYWGGKPHLAGVNLAVNVTPQTQVSELRAGQLDVALDANGQDVNSLAGNSQFKVLSLVGAEQQTYLGFNVANPALKNVRLREAIAYAIDRKRIATQVIGGDATTLSLPWPSYSPAYSAGLNATYNLDVAKAKQLIATVGKVPTLPIQFDAELPNVQEIAEVIQSDLGKVGIHTTLQPLQAVQFSQGLLDGKFSALWISPAQFAQFTPSTLAVAAYPFNAAKNSSNFVSAEYTNATDDAWETPDGTGPAARQAYDTLDHVLLNSLFLTEIAGVSPRIVTTSSLYDVGWGKESPQLFLNDAYLTH